MSTVSILGLPQKDLRSKQALNYISDEVRAIFKKIYLSAPEIYYDDPKIKVNQDKNSLIAFDPTLTGIVKEPASGVRHFIIILKNFNLETANDCKRFQKCRIVLKFFFERHYETLNHLLIDVSISPADLTNSQLKSLYQEV